MLEHKSGNISGTILDPYDHLFPIDIAFSTPTKTPITVISGRLRLAFQIFYAHSKTFRALIYKVHRTVIFAIAQLS